MILVLYLLINRAFSVALVPNNPQLVSKTFKKILLAATFSKSLPSQDFSVFIFNLKHFKTSIGPNHSHVSPGLLPFGVQNSSHVITLTHFGILLFTRAF